MEMNGLKATVNSNTPYSRVVATEDEAVDSHVGHAYPEPALDRFSRSCFDWRSPSFHRVAIVACVLCLLLAVNTIAIGRLVALVQQQRASHTTPLSRPSSASYAAFNSSTSSSTPPRFRIAVYTVGLGVSYFQLALDFVESAQRYLCTDRPDVTIDYFIFTNHDWKDAEGGWLNWKERTAAVDSSNIHLIPQLRRGWPFDSDMRYEFMDNHTNDMAAEEVRLPYTNYVWSDSDNHFVAPICSELLGDLIATQHPHFFTGCGDPYPYETRPESAAYVPQSMQRLFPYYTAHLYAATASRFKHLISTLAAATRTDRAAGIQALVDDESHLQRYFVDHIPTAVLSRAFVWPEVIEKDGTSVDGEYVLDLERLGGMRCRSVQSRLKQRTGD